VGEDRLAELEAELDALSARLDRLPSDYSNGLDSSPCEPSGPYAGYAFVFAKPHFTENISHRIGYRTFVPFSHDYELTPRAWFGYVGPSGLGLRYRYWQFDHGGAVSLANASAYAWVVSSPLPIWEQYYPVGVGASTLTIANGLEVHASDVEFTQRIRLGCSRLTVAGGLRYARIDQTYRAVATDELGQRRGLLIANRSFQGLGPTMAAEFNRPFGFWGLSLFGGARGSVVFGDSDAVVFSRTSSGDATYRNDDADKVMGIGEAEIGLEWRRSFSSRADVFIRGGYEGQLWQEAGSPNNPAGDLGFEGFSLALGFAR
ncbi:MAG: Lpg1974 family pore-forming outer membrane protein, partial [Planctomycetota bacterium]